MSGMKKTARKLHKKMRKVHKKFDPVGGRIMEKADKKVEQWTDENVWADMENPDIPQEAEAAPVMPIPDESGAEIEARRRRARANRSGRESTILTGRLGG